MSISLLLICYEECRHGMEEISNSPSQDGHGLMSDFFSLSIYRPLFYLSILRQNPLLVAITKCDFLVHFELFSVILKVLDYPHISYSESLS